ncbi:MAG: acyloxyacyl hydrolase [Verrucomicrobia bacterium]|nr:acyloxyacyl hydrolase [Verrucomicrobiota bacterium]
MLTSSSIFTRIASLLLASLLLLSQAQRLQAGDNDLSDVSDTAAPTKNVIDSWFIDFDTAALWKITNTTDLNYFILPQTLSWRSPHIFRWDLGGGDLIVRNRLSLLTQYFQQGAESYYLGFSGSPALEWWNAEQNFSLYFYIGGGAGFVDSTNIDGGQGQDFTFNWFVQTGARFRLNETLFVTGGLLFQHLSNQGLSERNPGLNALGPTFGLSWQF